MQNFREDIWSDGEYNYAAAYGFIPNIYAYLHDDDENRDCLLIAPEEATVCACLMRVSWRQRCSLTWV